MLQVIDFIDSLGLGEDLKNIILHKKKGSEEPFKDHSNFILMNYIIYDRTNLA